MKIFIATPAYRGITCPQYLDALEATVALFTENGIDSQYYLLQGCCYVQVARNNIVSEFLKSDCDKLLFLDDDISWNPKDALDLVTTDRNIVAGVYPLKKDDAPFPVVVYSDNNDRPIFNDRFVMATRVPTGFLCCTRSVFELLRVTNPELAYEDNELGSDVWETKFDYFPQGVKHGRWVGEDFAFCDLWISNLGRIYVIPDMTFNHHSPDKTYTGNLWEYLTSLPGGSNEKNG